MSERMVMWRACIHGDSPWAYHETLSELLDTIGDGATPGDTFLVECVSMTREEFEALPDFNGW